MARKERTKGGSRPDQYTTSASGDRVQGGCVTYSTPPSKRGATFSYLVLLAVGLPPAVPTFVRLGLTSGHTYGDAIFNFEANVKPPI